MQRSQFIAALIVLAVVVGLFAGRLGSGPDGPADNPADNPAEKAVDAAAAPDGPSDPESVDGSGTQQGDQEAAITGGEQASVGSAASEATLVVAEPPPLLGEKPELRNLDGWLQTDATGLDSFDGQVKIVQFWTFGCYNCKNTIPHLQEIYADWHDDGLEIIGVHAPEFDHEADVDNIAAAAVDLGVTWPIALDTEKTNFRSWQEKRRFWPRTYVIDQNGQVRFDRIGEGAYTELADTVAYLIENGP